MKRYAGLLVGVMLVFLAGCSQGVSDRFTGVLPPPVTTTATSPPVASPSAGATSAVPSSPATSTVALPPPDLETCTELGPVLQQVQATMQSLNEHPDGSTTSAADVDALISNLSNIRDMSSDTSIDSSVNALINLLTQLSTSLKQTGSVSYVPLKLAKASGEALIASCNL